MLYAHKLDLTVIYQDDYKVWWEVSPNHIFDFHYEYGLYLMVE
uniref:Uncharacterized protein n=1 Tax=Podoviridae sp. ctz6O13 TaxID=2827757 RepID=A0A8S5TKF6_9CAUD|nr:MAG TPA: hypothetical protein [Podoviridae sp. ctz6O13]